MRGCTRLEIPAHTTSRIQPLDVFFNRQWKVIARRIFDYVQLDGIAINLSERNNIIRLNSRVHNQLSSHRFMSMIKYSWFAGDAAGGLKRRGGRRDPGHDGTATRAHGAAD